MARFDDINRVTVRIYDEDHVMLVSKDKSPEYVKQLAHSIDKQMDAIKSRNPKLSSTKVAIMVALQLQDQLNGLKEECNQLYKILIEYEEKQSEGKK